MRSRLCLSRKTCSKAVAGRRPRRLTAARPARSEAGSVSAFVKHAVDIALSDAAGWQEMLSGALRQTGGPLTSKERAWADSILSPHQPKRRSRKPKAA